MKKMIPALGKTMVLLALIFIATAPTNAADWPDCGFQCTAGDVTLVRAYLGDSSGNPLTTCSIGTPVSANLWVEIYNNANSRRYAVILLADIYVDDVLKTSLWPNGVCVVSSINAKKKSKYKLYSFSWTCGQTVKLSKMILSWETQSGITCTNANRKCANRGTKCYGGLDIEAIAETPLVSDFTSTSPQCCCNLAFQAKPHGGKTPYTYDWNFGDGSPHSTLSEPTHTYPAAGTYTVNLKVTDSSGATASTGRSLTLYPLPQADAGPDRSVRRGSSTNIGGAPTASSGTGPYTYIWSPTTGLNNPSFANPTATPATTTSYTVNVTDSHGCQSTDSMNLYVSDISLSKSSSPSQATVGQTVTYTYLVRNSGDTTLTLNSLIDNRTGTVTTLNRTIITPGQAASATSTYTVTIDNYPGPLINSAQVSAVDGYGLAQSAQAQASLAVSVPLSPLLECVQRNEDGSYTAFYGYQNLASTDFPLAIGPFNRFVPSPEDRGQPAVFVPGIHHYVLSIPFSGNTLTWTLGSSSASASADSESCPVADCLITGPPTLCTNGNSVFLQNTEIQPGFLYVYQWKLDGIPMGTGNVLTLQGQGLSPGMHTLALTVTTIYGSVKVATKGCEYSLKVIQEPSALVEIVSVI